MRCEPAVPDVAGQDRSTVSSMLPAPYDSSGTMIHIAR
jgi:hypothetical protein